MEVVASVTDAHQLSDVRVYLPWPQDWSCFEVIVNVLQEGFWIFYVVRKETAGSA